MSLQLKNGISILKLAIKKSITTSKASIELGLNDKYFRDVLKRIDILLKNRKITKNEYDQFMNLYNQFLNLKNDNTDYEKNINLDKKTTDLNTQEEYDDRSYYEIIRDENNKILTYNYFIYVRDQQPIIGSLTRLQMELIYSNYPYVTQNTCSSYFPYLTFIEFKKILRVFNITKDKLFPPHFLEEKNSNEIAELALKAKEHASYKKFVESKGNFIEKELRNTQKELIELKEEREWIENVINKYYQTPSIKLTNKSDFILDSKTKYIDNPCFMFFSDIHYGKKFNDPVFGRGYNKDIAHERIMQIAVKTINYVIENKCNKINISFLGDLLESVIEDGMRVGHQKHMDLDGDEQIFFAVDSIKECLMFIYEHSPTKDISINLIGGNHDRLGVNRDDDKKRTASNIAFRILQRELSNYINFNIPTNPVFTVDVDQICLIGFHGDSSITKRKPQEIINLFGNGKTSYHIIISGHYHSVDIKSGTNYMTLSLPSVCSTDEFIQFDLGINNLPGFIIGKKSNNQLAFDFNYITLY